MTSQMQSTIAALVASGKGILAAAESVPTIEKRFKALDIVSTEENRRAYREMRVVLEQMLVKTGMVLSGAECPQQADVAVVAETTLRCLRRAVPAAVPAIVFLSGGQSADDATQRLNAICRTGDAPWKLSFSFGRALQAPALAIWKGLSSNIPAAQEALHHRAQCNSAAIQGKYSVQMERAKN